MYNLEHKAWLDNEYSLWVKALNESTVHNFKEHPMVKRMLGEVDRQDYFDVVHYLSQSRLNLIGKIDIIGCIEDFKVSGTCLRMVHHALEVLKRNPASIVEIGGGVGQFYAILKALGYKGEYLIYDLPEVREFQEKYLKEVEKQTGLNLPFLDSSKRYFVVDNQDCFCVSLYALGEFDDETKKNYIGSINDVCGHGYIAWNAHSGASDDLSLFTHDIKVTEGREPNIKIIEW